MTQEPSDREPQANLAVYLWILALSCGLAIGAGIGAALGRIGAGIGMGTAAGVAVGLLLLIRFKRNSADG